MDNKSPLGLMSSDSIWNAISTKASFNSWRNAMKREFFTTETKKYEVKPTGVYHVMTAYRGSGIYHWFIYVFLERRDFPNRFDLVATFHKMNYQNIESSLEAGNILKFFGASLNGGGPKEVVLALSL